ncbi:MAG: soluble lytic murein transglycosylase [Chloroflexi bacterium]|nr:MAG: soluble lytic murein transglycosylase [Chloroflexota bacterium]
MGSKLAALWLLALLGLSVASCGGDDPTNETPAPAEQSSADEPAGAEAESAPDAAPAGTPPQPRAEPLITAQVLLNRAAQLEHDGFWEAASEARSLALTDPSASALAASVLGDAYLAQIRLLLRLDQPGRAGATMTDLETSAAHIPASQRSLVRGRVLTANGQAEAALAAYDAYIEAGGAAHHFARLERARLQNALGRIDSALLDYESVRDDPTSPPLDLESALLEGGLLLENDARYAQADAWYQDLARVSPWLSDDTFALHRSGAVRLQQGDIAGAAAAWTELLQTFPGHWRAVEAYDGLLAANVAIDPLIGGLYFYRQSRFDDAIFTYNSLLAGAPTAAEVGVATYYLAAIDEDLGADDPAIEGYLAALAADPAGPQADDALWWAGRLLEAQDSHTLARLLFERLAAEYPASPFADEAAFRVPLSHYRAGDLATAALGFQRLTNHPDQSQRAALWLGKSLDALGDRAEAEAALAAAQTGDPHSYHALRAQAIAAGTLNAPTPQLGPITLTDSPGATPLDVWLDALPGADAASGTSITASPHWLAALDLWAIGLTRSAEARFRLAIDTAANPWALLQAARAFDAMGTVQLRLAAALALLDRVPSSQRAAAPSELLRWAYPRGWPELAATFTRNFNVDELLIYALIRQESRFNPEAGSIAGALGLTQVIPSTGADIARSLGDAGFETNLLFRAERAIRYGAAYLGAQLTNFQGAVDIALAAYNGGPGSAARWSRGAAAVDPDLFYEAVTFNETRAYLRLVLENYAWYQFLYRGAAAPTLLANAPAPAGR